MPVYPSELVSEWRAPDGTAVTIRPIRPEDAGIEQEFVKSLSPEAKYLRFMGTVEELTPAMLKYFTQVDYDRDMALVAVVHEGARERQVAVARYVLNPDGESCEFAIVVAEAWQGCGLGKHLLLQLIAIARARGIKVMVGQALAANPQMLGLAIELGFSVEDGAGSPTVKELRLSLAVDR